MKKYFILVLIFLIIFGVTGTIKAEEYEITAATGGAVGSPEYLAVNFFVKQLEERTNGRIKGNPYGAELGTATEQLENVMSGNQTVYFGELTWLANLNKDLNITAMAFIFQNNEHLVKFLESEKGTKIWNDIRKEKGINVLDFHGQRLPRVVMSKRPLYTLDDFQSFKMRVPEIPIYMRVWDAIGTNTNRVAWGEIYMALSQGLIDGHEGPIDGILEVLTFEQAPYMLRTDHVYSLYTLSINDKFYQKLPEDLKQTIKEVTKETMTFVSGLTVGKEEETINGLLEEGTIIIYNEKLRTQLRDKVSTLAPKLEKEGFWSEGLYEYVQLIK